MKITEKNEKLDDWHSSKIQISKDWIETERSQKNRKVNQGEIYYCNIGENIGHEQNELRPVLIVSENRYNKKGIITILPLTTKVVYNGKRPKYDTHYILKKENYKFLKSDSAVMSEHIKSVSIIRLIDYIGQVSQQDYKLINIRMKSLLGL